MAHLLHIDSSPRGERSHTRRISHEFVQAWKAEQPDGSVTYRDLGHHPVPFVDEAWVAAAFTPPQEHTPELQEAIRLSNDLVDEFLAADLYVFGVPMYNFGMPAVFKAYIDQIARVGRTFSVDANGYKGLVHGKKMCILTARGGGGYGPGGAMEAYNYEDPHLRAVFNFIGVTDINFIHLENLNRGDEVIQQSMIEARDQIQKTVTSW